MMKLKTLLGLGILMGSSFAQFAHAEGTGQVTALSCTLTNSKGEEAEIYFDLPNQVVNTRARAGAWGSNIGIPH